MNNIYKAAIVTPVFWPVGAIGYPHYMALSLKENGYDVTVHTMNVKPDGNKIYDDDIWNGIKIIRHSVYGRLGEFAKNWIPYLKEYNLIHFCGGYRHVHSTLGYLTKNKTSTVIFSPFYPVKPRKNKLLENIAKLYDGSLGKLLFKSCDVILAETNVEKDWLKSLGVPEHLIYIIPNPLPETAFENYDKTKFRIKYNIGNRKIVFFLGGHSYIKNVELLLKIAPAIDAVFVIGGEGELTEKYKKIVETLQITEQIIFPGSFFGEYKKKMEAFASADVVILPSLHEGLGGVLLEGMAQSKPVLASDVGGLPDVVPDKFCLFDLTNTDELIRKLRTLLYDTNYAEYLGNKGRKKAEKYSYHEISKKYINLVISLLSKS